MKPLATRQRLRAGLTLIELLAVILIVSFAAGAALVRLGPLQEDVALRSTAAALRELDARARLHVLRGKRIRMEVDHERCEVRLVAIESREVVGREELPAGASLRILSGGEVVTTLAFDRTGRSADYAVRLERENRRISWRIGGATGLVLPQGGEP